jgi:hypothetical protein
VLGLVAGEGLHGAADAPRLVAELGRADAAYAGTIGSLDGIGDLVAAALARAIGCTGTPAVHAAVDLSQVDEHIGH